MATNKYQKLSRTHVLILGGTSGLGYSVAEASLSCGAIITISSSPSSRVSTVSSLQFSFPSSKITGYACDLSTPELEKNITTLFKNAVRAGGKIDHVVFTAGDRLATIPLAENTYESIIAAGQVRFFAPLLVAEVSVKYMDPGPQSSIILTTGAVADHPAPDWSVVASHAAGLHGMTQNLVLDLMPARVNLPEDVAEAYLWLMRDSNVTGTVANSDSESKLV